MVFKATVKLGSISPFVCSVHKVLPVKERTLNLAVKLNYSLMGALRIMKAHEVFQLSHLNCLCSEENDHVTHTVENLSHRNVYDLSQ